MATGPFIGRWRVEKCLPICGECEDLEMLNQLEFELTKCGDVLWFPNDPTSSSSNPLFDCDTFEVLRERDGLSVAISLRFGAYNGHILSFRVELQSETRKGRPLECMWLSYTGWCSIQCRHLVDEVESSMTSPNASKPNSPRETDWSRDFGFEDEDEEEAETIGKHPFHFASALSEGFFSDLTIVSRTNTRFRVHKSVLGLTGNSPEDIGYLQGLDDRTTEILLHYLYTMSLKEDSTLSELADCAEIVKDRPDFERFRGLCRLYERNSATCDGILTLVNDIHNLGNKLIFDFGGRTGYVDEKEKMSRSAPSATPESLLRDPAKLSLAIKNSIKWAVLGLVKLLQLGDIFNREKSQLTRRERKEIIQFAKNRLPHFLSQVTRFLAALKNITTAMKPQSRVELASYFVAEIEVFADIVNRVGFDIKEIIETLLVTEFICHDFESGLYFEGGDSRRQHRPKSLKELIRTKEKMYFKKFNKHVGLLFNYLIQIKESFAELVPGGKVRTISQQMEEIAVELPLFIMRVKDFANVLEERLDYGTFKFCFVVGTSFIDNMLRKLRKIKDTRLKIFLDHFCAVLQIDELPQALSELGLMDVEAGQRPPAKPKTPRTLMEPFGHKHLNLCRSAKISPPASANELAERSLELFEKRRSATDQDCDLEIVVQEGEQAVCFPCHRVILAARCPYFKRALQSGMREEIERKIEVHDVRAESMRLFLKYAYSGLIDFDALTAEQETELLMLADRYELDSLKSDLESVLISQIEADSAITLLAMGDHFNATMLKGKATEFILKHPELRKSRTFDDLNEPLRKELDGLLTWGQMATERTLGKPQEPMNDLVDLTSQLRLRSGFSGDDDEIETIPLTHDSNQLEVCVSQLRDILGPLIPQDQLVRVALAADYDVNRAVNYFFQSPNLDEDEDDEEVFVEDIE